MKVKTYFCPIGREAVELAEGEVFETAVCPVHDAPLVSESELEMVAAIAEHERLKASTKGCTGGADCPVHHGVPAIA